MRRGIKEARRWRMRRVMAMPPRSPLVEMLISGGQSGADRAALDVAVRHGLPHGGWCPAGRLAEDGPIGGQYQLTETPSARYEQRTEWNVRDSDGTVVFTGGPRATGGSMHTIACARKLGKPWVHIQRNRRRPAFELQRFVTTHQVRRLNVAGSRESTEPGIYLWVVQVLEDALFWSGNPPHACGGLGEG